MRLRRHCPFGVVLVLLATISPASSAQSRRQRHTVTPDSQPAATFTGAGHYGIQTSMRDGVKLAADLYLPADTGRYPVILIRTVYGRVGTEIELPKRVAYFTKHGYAVMIQDVRGRGDSNGEYDFYWPDGQDGYDTIEWIARQPWSTGKVGMMGVSYLGAVQWLAAREHPPHLACITPTAPSGRYFDELPRIGGAFLLQWALAWTHGTSLHAMQPMPPGIDLNKLLMQRPILTLDSALTGRRIAVWRRFLAHPTLDDYWRRIMFTPKDFSEITIPTFTTAGWFDGDQPGALYYWRGLQANSPARDRQYLMIGPWTHPQTFLGGALKEGGFEFTPDSRIDNDAVRREFFDYCLKGITPAPQWPKARVYLTGSNVWLNLDTYPARGTRERSLYLHSGGSANTLTGDGRLSWQEPASEAPDRYTFDPRRPAPGSEHMRDSAATHDGDNRAAEKRADVLVYTSEPLTEPLDILGDVQVELFAASDARDTDFMVKLLDVQPDGRALRLGVNPVGAIRARFRMGRDRQVLLTPGQVEKYRIELFDIGHTFLPGHRIRLEVLSNAAPFINPNQNTGNPMATDTTWVTAHQTIHHDHAQASRIILPVLPAGTVHR